jgi:hypothetical protein
MAVTLTAYRRPMYLAQTLEGWSKVKGVNYLRQFAVALRPSDRARENLEVIKLAQTWFRIPITLRMQSSLAMFGGPHSAIAWMVSQAFADPQVDFVVASEEDVLPSDDALLFMRWAARFQKRSDVLAVCAHSQSGQGWDAHEPADDADADQAIVRLLPYYNAWCWGTWRETWNNLLLPDWDWTCTSGGPTTSGYDWNIQQRILPKHGGLCVVPDASRSQNIGEHEGLYTTPWSFSFSQAQSFRARRGHVAYQLEK